MANENINLDALTGIKIAELSPAQLSALQSALSGVTQAVQARTDEIKKTMENEVFAEVSKYVGDIMSKKLTWAKLPAVLLTPDAEGKVYVVSYYTPPSKTRSTTRKEGEAGKRAAPTAEEGKITINKIGVAKGGIAMFQDDVTNRQFENLKDLVKELKQPADSKNPGASEGDRCWDIQHKLGNDKGISASEIVTRYHADAVTLVYENGQTQKVKDAVTEMEAARKAAADAKPQQAQPPAEQKEQPKTEEKEQPKTEQKEQPKQ